MINRILNFDKNISEKFFLREDQKALRTLSSLFAHSGDSWTIEVVLLIVWLFSRGLTRTISAYFAGSVIIQAFFVITIKFLIKRRRPEGTWGNIYRKTDPHSFPSGHAARAIMLSVLAFGYGLHTLGWIILVWGIIVSFSRVMLGVHFLIDILVGWMIGVVLGYAMLLMRPFFYDLIPFVF